MLAVAEPLRGRGRNSGGGHREYLREKQGGKVRAGARFAMTQVINCRGISPGISGYTTTLSRLFRGSQRIPASK